MSLIRKITSEFLFQHNAHIPVERLTVMTMKIQEEPRSSLEALERTAGEEPLLDRECAPSIVYGKAEETIVSDTQPNKREEFLAAAKKSTVRRSNNIPILNRLRRTESETRLDELEQLAEIRDCAMFTRLVNGITQRQASTTNDEIRSQNDLCLAHIVATHYLSKEELEQPCDTNKKSPNVTTTNNSHDCFPLQCTCPLGRLGQDELQEFLLMNQNHGEHNDHVEMFDMDL